VAREGASRLLLREPVAGLLRLGLAHSCKLYHSAEQNRKLGGFTLSQAKAIQRARKEHENFRAEFESILRGIEGSMERQPGFAAAHDSGSL